MTFAWKRLKLVVLICLDIFCDNEHFISFQKCLPFKQQDEFVPKNKKLNKKLVVVKLENFCVESRIFQF